MSLQELEEVGALARRAGAALMEIYATDFGVEWKGKSDPVTEADRRVNALIVEFLRRRFPEDGVVAEETEDRSDALRQGRCWYVDPLDGTKEFISKNGEFSVMIGLAIDGHAHLGVVYQPAKDKLYAGVVGEGAWLEEGGARRSLRVSDEREPSKLKLVVSRSHRPASIEAIMAKTGIRHEMPSGSVGLKIGLIAERVADVYVHVSDKSSAWDACAPEAILRAAGGVFSDCYGARFRYGGVEMANKRGIFACNAVARDAILPAVVDAARDANLAAPLPE